MSSQSPPLFDCGSGLIVIISSAAGTPPIKQPKPTHHDGVTFDHFLTNRNAGTARKKCRALNTAPATKNTKNTPDAGGHSAPNIRIANISRSPVRPAVTSAMTKAFEMAETLTGLSFADKGRGFSPESFPIAAPIDVFSSQLSPSPSTNLSSNVSISAFSSLSSILFALTCAASRLLIAAWVWPNSTCSLAMDKPMEER